MIDTVDRFPSNAIVSGRDYQRRLVRVTIATHDGITFLWFAEQPSTRNLPGYAGARPYDSTTGLPLW